MTEDKNKDKNVIKEIQKELYSLNSAVDDLEYKIDDTNTEIERNSDRIKDLTNKILSDNIQNPTKDMTASIISYLAYFCGSSYAGMYKYVVINDGILFATNMYIATRIESESFKELPNGYYRSDILQNLTSVDALGLINSDSNSERYLKPVFSELEATIKMMKELSLHNSKSIPEYSLSVNNLKQIADFCYAIQTHPTNIRFITSADFKGRKVVLCQTESKYDIDIEIDFLLSPVRY